MKNANQQPQTFSSKILMTLMAFIYPFISFGVGYLVINLLFRWISFDFSFRYLLLNIYIFDLDDIFKTFKSFFIFSGASILLALLPVQIFRSRYTISLCYGLIGILFLLVLMFYGIVQGNSATGLVVYLFIPVFLGTIYSYISIFIITKLWPFTHSRGKFTFFIVMTIILLYVVMISELFIGRSSGTQKIHSIETIQAKPEIITKEEFNSISEIGRQATIPDDKKYVSRRGIPIKWVDDERLIYDIYYGAKNELWIKNIRNQEALILIPIGAISHWDLFTISPDKKWAAFTTDFIDAIDTTITEITGPGNTYSKFIGGGIILVKLDGTKIVRIHPPICGSMVEDDPLFQFGRYCDEIKWDDNSIYVSKHIYEEELFIKLKFPHPSE